MIKQNANKQTIQILVGGWQDVGHLRGYVWGSFLGWKLDDHILLLNPDLRRFSFKVIYLAKVFHWPLDELI